MLTMFLVPIIFFFLAGLIMDFIMDNSQIEAHKNKLLEAPKEEEEYDPDAELNAQFKAIEKAYNEGFNIKHSSYPNPYTDKILHNSWEAGKEDYEKKFN